MKKILFVAAFLTLLAIAVPTSASAQSCCAEGITVTGEEPNIRVTYSEWNGSTCRQKTVFRNASGVLEVDPVQPSSESLCAPEAPCVVTNPNGRLTTPLGPLPYRVATCNGTAPSTFQCCSDGSRYEGGACAGGGTYTCAADKVCQDFLDRSGQSCENPIVTIGEEDAGKCCKKEFAISAQNVSIGWEETKPFLGKCIWNYCYDCYVLGRCEPSVVSRSFGFDTPEKVKKGCDVSTPLRAGYQCKGADIKTGDPGEACEENTNTCKKLVTAPTTVNCPGGTGTCSNTAFGLINITTFDAFLTQVLQVALGLGGGIAFLAILYGAFKLSTSQGNPDAITEGKEFITAAIAGLVFLILAIPILQIIGVDILNLNILGF